MSKIQNVADPIIFVQAIIYILASYFLYRKALKKVATKKSLSLRWLKIYFTSTLIIVICVMPLGLINNGHVTGMYISLFSLVYFVVLVWQSMSTSKIFGSAYNAIEIKFNNNCKAAEELIKIIETRRLFANKEITLDSLAYELEMSKMELYTLLKNQLGISFNDFISYIRINEAKHNLLNPDLNHYKIDTIGFDAGFKSRSTFYETFKKQTGSTPTEFRNKRNEIEN